MSRRVSISSLNVSEATAPSKSRSAAESQIPLVDLDENGEQRTTYETSPTEPKPAPVNRARALQICQEWWLFELFAWLISAIALAIVGIVLRTTQDEPLPHWPLHLTINAVISIMATLIKATILVPIAAGIGQLKWLWIREPQCLNDVQVFDESSRGFLGSLKLLIMSRRIHLAQLGALLTILCLAIDPFIQQLVKYPTRPVQDKEYSASVPNIHSYTAYVPGSIGATKDPTPEMKTAIYNGIYHTGNDVDTAFTVSPYCPTGNCTWPQHYSSLAVCSDCEDLSSEVNRSCTGSTCSYKLPNQFGINDVYSGRGAFNSTSSTGFIKLRNDFAKITSLTTIQVEIGSQEPVARECVLYFCINTYEGQVETGNFEGKIVSSFTKPLPNVSGGSGVVDLSPIGSKDNFTIENLSLSAISLFFSSTIQWNGDLVIRAGTVTGTDVLKMIKDVGSNAVMQATANSMTRHLRMQVSPQNTENSSSAGSDNSTAIGIAWSSETYVHIQWAWFILPVLIEVLALVFILMTIAKSRSSQLTLWKNSLLAALQCHVESSRQTSEQDQSNADDPTHIIEHQGATLYELEEWAKSPGMLVYGEKTEGSEPYTNTEHSREIGQSV